MSGNSATAAKNEWRVYMVRCADGTLYTGIAKDIESRIARHNTGQGAKYTRGRRPVSLVYQELAEDRGAALRRELAIKRMPPVVKRRLIAASSAQVTQVSEFK